MSIRFSRPSVADLRALADAGTAAELTYGPVGISAMESPAEGYRLPDGTSRFEIVAASRPQHPLARLFPPAARRLQAAATNRYLAAMDAAVSR